MKTTLISWLVLAFSSVGFAAGITYHGRLLKPDGLPVAANPVKFKIQLRSPGSENCLMYQETHAVDMSTSDGIFAITINDGTATVVNTEPFSLDRVFQNRGTFAFAGGKCALGNSYAPNPTDGRRIVVEFDDGLTGGWEPLPAQSINFVPMALESLTLSGYGSGSMLRVNDGTGAPASISALTQSQYNAFIDLLSGSSSLYLTSSSALNGSNLAAGSVDDTKLASGITGSKITGNISGNAAGFTGSLTGDVTGSQSSTVVGKLQGRAVDATAPTNGQVLKWSTANSRWEPAADSTGASGTVMSVTGTGSVVMTGTATDPIVGVQDASSSQKGVVQLATNGQSAANVVVQGNDSRLSDARAPTSHHHGVDEIDSAAGKYFLYKPNNAQCADGQVLKWVVASQRWECGTDAGSAGTIASLTVNAPLVKTGTASDPVLSVNDASLVQKGAVQLASSADNTAGLVVQANDTRLNDSRAPTAHTHVVDQITSAAGKYFSYLPNNAPCADGQLLKWNLAQTRWECGAASSGESTTVSNIGTAGVGVYKQLTGSNVELKKLNAASSALSLTDDTLNNKIDIGVNTELGGLANLGANGFVKRTAAGAYSTVSSIGIPEMNMNGLMGNNTGLLVTDGTQLQNKACSPNEVLKWLSPSGWTCAADAVGIAAEVDPKVGANTTNYLSKWNGTALVASGVIESGGNVGIGTATPGSALHVNGTLRAQQICDTNGSNCKTISSGWSGGSSALPCRGGAANIVYNGRCYSLFKFPGANGPNTWTNAAAVCRAWGGSLAEIKDSNINDLISNELLGSFTSTQSLWVGGADFNQEGQFNWMASHTPVSYTNWMSGEPTNYDSSYGVAENCIAITAFGANHGKWNDGACDTGTVNPSYFICEAESTPMSPNVEYSGGAYRVAGGTYKTSCLAYLTAYPELATFDSSFWIDPDGAGAIVPFKAFCDMTTDGGGYTFYPVASGIGTNRYDANNTCKGLGMDIFVPRTKAHLSVAVGKYGVSYFNAVPGIYNLNTNAAAACTTNPMRETASYGTGCSAAGWRALDGGKFWIRDTNYSEPNGNYTAGCWLSGGASGAGFNNISAVTYDDNNCGTTTTKYICSTNDKP